MSTFKILARSTVFGINYAKSVQITTAHGFKKWLAPTLRDLERRRKKLGPQPPPIRSSYLEWNYKAEWYAFGKRLHEEFNEQSLQCAFTHRSYIIKEEELQKQAGIVNPEVKLEDNRKLIEEGESFMKDYIRKYVSLLLPKFPEEGISAVCNYLMDNDTLAYISEHLGTKDLILSEDTPPEKETLAFTLKAIVGALLESSGPVITGCFVRDFIITILIEKDVNDLWSPENPLATLNNIIAREGRGIPEPRLINEAGRNTVLSTYEVALYSDKQFLGSGAAETIDFAVQLAALDSLKRLFRTTDSMPPFSFKLNPLVDDVAPVNHVSISNWSTKNIVSC